MKIETKNLPKKRQAQACFKTEAKSWHDSPHAERWTNEEGWGRALKAMMRLMWGTRPASRVKNNCNNLFLDLAMPY